jgi:hypothetical protein
MSRGCDAQARSHERAGLGNLELSRRTQATLWRDGVSAIARRGAVCDGLRLDGGAATRSSTSNLHDRFPQLEELPFCKLLGRRL